MEQDKRRIKRAPLKTCLVCSNEFYATNEQNGKFGGQIIIRKYCSKICWSNRNPPTIKSCLICQKEFSTYGKERISKIFCSNECRNISYTGRKLSPLTIKKMSLAKKGKIPKNAWKRGKLHPFWNPDRTDYRERDTIDYTNWRLAVLKRDNFACQSCGARGKKGFRPTLHVDHIKPFATYHELRTVLSNGRTLCVDCHHKTDTWGKKKAKLV